MGLEILKKYNIKAKKSLWQNFLVNDEIVKQIAEIADIKWQNIIEVGPGYWALTEKLLVKNPKRLTLIELDRDMVEVLEKRVKNWDLKINNIDFQIKNIDILKFIPEYENYYVIANIPYYITSPILRHFLYDVEKNPEKMIILMQKDVWNKIINSKKSSVLSLMISKKAKVEEKIFVAKDNFIPAPKVESSVLLFELHNLYDKYDDEKFLDFIKKSFTNPRKKLVNNLAKFWYDKKEIIKKLQKWWFWENTRPEELNINDWCELIKSI